MHNIMENGLVYAADKLLNGNKGNVLEKSKVGVGEKRKIIIVGGGIAGLTAAYELAQIGHDVSSVCRSYRFYISNGYLGLSWVILGYMNVCFDYVIKHILCPNYKDF